MIHPFLELALAARATGPAVDDIAEIVCGVAPWYVPIVCEPRAEKLDPAGEYQARTSLPLSVALALVDGRVDDLSYAPESVRRPVVRELARRITHVEDADLISYGLVGLIGAIERFEPERGIKFETFAMTRIRGSIIDELRSLDWVPRSVRSRAREIETAQAKLEHELQRAPTEAELAAKLGMTESELQSALLEIANSSVYALDELWTVSDSSGDQVSLLDTIADDGAADPQEALASNEVKDRLTEAIGSLPEREQLVVALYYYENLTLREIGEVLGVTESRVSQLHTKAVMRLKSHLQQP